jgi:TolA-binding protein
MTIQRWSRPLGGYRAPIALLALLLFFVLPASAQSGGREAERELNFADQMLSNQPPMARSAVDAYRSFLQKYPSHSRAADARYGLARSLEILGDTEASDAYRAFLKSHTAHPKVADARYRLGLVLYAAGRWSDALAAFREFRERHPENPASLNAVYYEGLCLVKTSRPLEATALFESVASTATMPLKAEAAFSAAASHYQAGNPNVAAEALAGVSRSYPNTEAAAKAEALTGDILYRQAQFTEAARHYRHALSSGLLTYADEVQFWLAWSQVKAGDTASGAAALLTVEEKYPASRRAVDSLRQAAQLYAGLGDSAIALRTLDRLIASPRASDDARAEAQYTAALIAFQAGLTDPAKANLMEVLKADRVMQAEAEFILGQIEFGAGNYPQADAYLQSASKRNPDPDLEERIIIMRLNVLRASGNLPAYERLLQRLEQQRSPAVARILYGGAEMKEQAGDVDGAKADYRKLVSRFGQSPEARDALFRLGWLSYENASYAEAESHFLRFIAVAEPMQPVHPLLDDAWYWAGFARYQLDRMERAIDAFQRAAKIPGSDQRPAALFRAGNAAYNLRRYDDAIRFFEDVIAAPDADAPLRLDAIFNRAESLRSLGRSDEARAAYLEVFEKGGADFEQALFNSAAVWDDLGKTAEAADAYEAAAFRFTSTGRKEEALMKAGVSRIKLGETRRALTCFDSIAAMGGSMVPDALLRAADIRIKLGDTPGARRNLAVAADTWASTLYGRRAQLRLAVLGDSPDQAERVYKTLIKASPEDGAAAEARLRLGLLAFKRGQSDTATTILLEALDYLDDGEYLAEAKVALAQIYLDARKPALARQQAEYLYRSPLYLRSAFRADAGILLGRALARSNQSAEALKVLTEVADRYPESADVARTAIRDENLERTGR